jgi:two-component system, response regulator YesN
MYRFLMVDDEEIVRRGFEKKIDWRGNGFEFLPPCENGRDAIEAIDRLQPDVVMTDIHMPHADGLCVAAHVMESYPQIVVVVLSGYDEFSYAQAAIQNRVFDYVLKPVTSRDLAALLLKIKAKLDADRLTRRESAILKDQADHLGDILRERGVANFIMGRSAGLSGEEAKGLLGFDPARLSCAVIVAECDEREAMDPDLAARLEAARGAGRKSASFVTEDGRGVALAFDPNLDRAYAAALSVASALQCGSPALRVGVGRAYPGWEDAPRSFTEAKAALAYRLVRGAQKPFAYAQAAESRESLALIKSTEERLCLGLRSGACGRSNELAVAYLEALGSDDLSPQRLRHEINSLFARIRDEFSDSGIATRALSSGLSADYYSLTSDLDTREAIMSALDSLAKIAAASLGPAAGRDAEWKILDFKEFVARHFMDPGLSIGKASARLSISESYLSKLIRRELDTSFVDYLTDYRVERAKELLGSSAMRAYEVAEAVGWTDPRYFASIFHKRSGLTPSEYRASLSGGREGP